MNLETILVKRLWESIQSSYEARNFTGAILDAIYSLSDLIREKTGLQSDGTTLVGQALGGKSPKLKVNRLQTESEKNVQSGIEQILRGLFQAVRNPRSHEKRVDTQKDADSIILFVNYLFEIMDQSKTPFIQSEFLERVFDSHFVEKERYAELMVSEVPARKRIEVMLDVFRKKETGEGNKLCYFVQALLNKLTAEERKELFRVVSAELKTTDSDQTIRYVLQIFPAECLEELEEVARLRIENKLVKSIRDGVYIAETKSCKAGGLGTWAATRCKFFLLKSELINALLIKLGSSNVHEQEYVFQYFWHSIRELMNPPSPWLVNVLKKGLKSGNTKFYEALEPMRIFDEEWVEPFRQELDSFKESEQSPDAAENDIPF